MTATRAEQAVDGASAGPTRERSGLPAASLPESVTVLASGVLPALVRGLFAPRRRALKLLTALDIDRRTVSVLGALRRKHGGEGLRLLGGRIVVLWGADSIQKVLEDSAVRYGSDGGAKAKGMSHFQPDALTLSRGEPWRNRRRFTEAVLATQESAHPLAGRFLAVVAEEVSRLPIDGRLEWTNWETLFDRITLRVIFGDGAENEPRLTALLEKLMNQANRLIGLGPNDDYYEFYGLLERQLREPGEDSLLSRVAQAPHDDLTRIVHQIPHWMFAMRDTLAANTYRALVAIIADPPVQRRVREEIEPADLSDPAALTRMAYLEGCLQEAMRLWPTTPLLSRETIGETTLAGEKLEAGTQVLMINVFNHRATEHVTDPDRLEPERWRGGARDFRFNHLSNGSQDCPGGPLVLLLGKAVIARSLQRWALELERPRLTAGQPLPHSLDFFEACFSAGPGAQ